MGCCFSRRSMLFFILMLMFRNFKKTGGFGCPDRMMSVDEVFLRQEFTDAISFQQQFSK
jgi:hypothetical protein